MRILVVEDEPLLARGLTDLLRSRGHMASALDRGERALDILATERFDLIMLDIGLPGIDGLELLRRLRTRGDATPVLMLTARDALSDKVSGLNLGADDYLAKPFANEELLARVQALARRRPVLVASERRIGRLRVDLDASRAWIDDQALNLPAREWAVLGALLVHEGRVLRKERLITLVSSWDEELSSNAIETYISRLRPKLESAGVSLRTIRGLGYLLTVE